MEPRDRILAAAADLLDSGEPVSTRAVASAAGVQAPTLYRLFGDKDGLLAAVAAYGFERYLVDKHALGATDDPVADLRRGWDLHVGFGLAHPAFYALMYGSPSAPTSAAALEAAQLLRGIISRVAAAGRLRTSVERAAQMVQAAGVGVVLTMSARDPASRDPDLPVRTREAILAAILTESRAPSATSVAERAVALRAVLPAGGAFSDAELRLLTEWLDRLANT